MVVCLSCGDEFERDAVDIKAPWFSPVFPPNRFTCPGCGHESSVPSVAAVVASAVVGTFFLVVAILGILDGTGLVLDGTGFHTVRDEIILRWDPVLEKAVTIEEERPGIPVFPVLVGLVALFLFGSAGRHLVLRDRASSVRKARRKMDSSSSRRRR